jgi:hypothetical protein
MQNAFGPKESPEFAISETRDYANSSLQLAINEQAYWEGIGRAGYSARALSYLADGVHAVQDITSLLHGGKPWNPFSGIQHGILENRSAMSAEPSDEEARAEAYHETWLLVNRFTSGVRDRESKRHKQTDAACSLGSAVCASPDPLFR